ncbi:hypothetical protein OG206_07330 [Streptomyces sp. NBC_01341]|uniref:hypothetical protein n=1 Tax=Streptomyces sp. NBC_01341 TaxID=2903831 RepID=UPI002E1513EB|nr:hypothetical protein OG206_07330 [Streptomyces sp. NBC_01341]
MLPGGGQSPADPVLTPGSEAADAVAGTSAADVLGGLIAGLGEEVRPAVRVWDRSVADPIEELKDILTEPGSRSLVFGAQWDSPVWAINMAGLITWFSLGARKVPVPDTADGLFASIDIDPQGRLTGPAARALRTSGTAVPRGVKTGFCDLNMGVDLRDVLGRQGAGG